MTSIGRMTSQNRYRQFWLTEEQRAMEMLLGAEWIQAGGYYINFSSLRYYNEKGEEIVNDGARTITLDNR